MPKKEIQTLGTLAIYSAEGKSIRESITAMQDRAVKYGVPLHLLPRPQSKQGAFQRATTYVQETMTAEEPIVVKEVLNDRDRIIRVFEKRKITASNDLSVIAEGKKNIPLWEHVATMTFHKDTQDIDTSIVSKCGHKLVDKALAKYSELADYYDITRIRNMVENAFYHYQGIKFRRNGGVTFIPASNVNDFEKFTAMCDDIQGLQLLTVEITPSNDNKKNVLSALHQAVYSSIEEEISALKGETVGSMELDKLVATLAEALKNKDSLRQDRINRMVEDFKHTQGIVKTYQELLQVNMDETVAKLEIAKQQLLALVA